MDGSNHTQTATSQSNSPTSSSSELDKDIAEIDLNGSTTNGDDENGGTSSNGSLILINKTSSLKKRISSSRTPTRKAKRVRFFRNGDRFYGGIVIPVSNERYRYGFCSLLFMLKDQWEIYVYFTVFSDHLRV